MLVFFVGFLALSALTVALTDGTNAAPKEAMDTISDALLMAAQLDLVAEEAVSDAPVIADSLGSSTRDAVVGAAWAANVGITIWDGEFRYQSNGYPNHELPNQFLAQQQRGFAPPAPATLSDLDRVVPVVESPIDMTITLNPTLAEEVTEAPVGTIGVLINGAQLYRDAPLFDIDDVVSFEWSFVDICNGHPTAAIGDGAGEYHYHGVPTCTTDAVDVEWQHSSMIGVLIDGFPVYGSNDVGGVPVAPDVLDACSGHFGPTPEFPEGIYHYHLLDDVSFDPIPCLRGELPTPPATLPLQTTGE